MHQPLFADVEKSSAGGTVPGIRQAANRVLLEGVQVREGKQSGTEAQNPVVGAALPSIQGRELSFAVVQNADRAVEAEFARAGGNGVRVFRLCNRAAQHRVDGHIEFGVLSEPLKLAVEHLQALFRDVVRLNVIDADLQVIEPGSIQPLDALRHEKIAVGDQGSDGTAFAHALYQQIQIGMQCRFAAAEGDDAGAQRAELIDAAKHLFSRNRSRV